MQQELRLTATYGAEADNCFHKDFDAMNEKKNVQNSIKNNGIYKGREEQAEELKRGIIGLNICEECGGFCTESVPLIEGLPVNAQVSLMEHSVHIIQLPYNGIAE